MNWHHPLPERRVLAVSGVSEITPFIWEDRLYRVENFKESELHPGEALDLRFHQDGCRIVEADSGRVVSIPWRNHYFTTGTVKDGRLHLIGGDYEWDLPWWHIRRLEKIHSDDLIHWSEPEIILEAAGNEHLFNNAITSDGAGGYIMLYESDDPAYVPFSFKFARSRDLSHWEKIPDAVYGKDKYVGGPALYREGEWYYLLYLNHEEGFWSTRIARSRNLLEWEEAAPERVFLSPDFGHLTDPVHHPGVYECNASDAELIEWRGRVLVWFNGGDQRTCGDFKLSEFAGSRRELLEYFFI